MCQDAQIVNILKRQAHCPLICSWSLDQAGIIFKVSHVYIYSKIIMMQKTCVYYFLSKPSQNVQNSLAFIIFGLQDLQWLHNTSLYDLPQAAEAQVPPQPAICLLKMITFHN